MYITLAAWPSAGIAESDRSFPPHSARVPAASSLSLLLLPFSLFLSGLRTLLGSWDYPSNSHVDLVPTIYYYNSTHHIVAA